jgi:hypothetical protein
MCGGNVEKDCARRNAPLKADTGLFAGVGYGRRRQIEQMEPAVFLGL